MKFIRSRDNPQFKLLSSVASSSRERRKTGMALLDGENLISAYRDTGQSACILAIGETAYAEPEQRRIFEAISADIRLLVADQLLTAVSQVVTTAGLLAAIKIPKPSSWPKKIGNCLLLEGIQDPGNLGAILRTAAAAGINHIAVSKGSASAWSPKVLRAGMGAHFQLQIHEDADLLAIARGFQGKIVATQPRAEKTIYSADLSGSVAWMFGNEGAGLSAAVMQYATEQLRIPMPGPAESLNVTGAVAVCLFEQLRQING